MTRQGNGTRRWGVASLAAVLTLLATASGAWAESAGPPIPELQPLPDGSVRDYGTPTPAPGKVCPFIGDIPVSVPAITSPAGSSLPGLAGATLDRPAVRSEVHAELCMTEESWREAQSGAPPAVLVLSHGITYGTWYWDLPHQPERYSAVNYFIARGYATLNYDRIGDGRSGHPPSAFITAGSNAEVLHQLIGVLRRGAIAATKFAHVGLVGHSYGTVTNWIESAMYGDADISIDSGYSDRAVIVF